MTPHKKTRDRRRARGVKDGTRYGPICSKCDQPNDRFPQRYCKKCHNTYQRNWRAEMTTVPRDALCFMEDA